MHNTALSHSHKDEGGFVDQISKINKMYNTLNLQCKIKPSFTIFDSFGIIVFFWCHNPKQEQIMLHSVQDAKNPILCSINQPITQSTN